MNVFSSAAPFLGIAWAALAAGFGVLWWRQTRSRDATSVDAGWSGAIGSLAILAAIFADGSPLQRILLAVVATIWSSRLTWHLLADRVWSGAPEDGRYRALREHFGDRERIGFFWVYQLQAFLALFFAAPFVIASWGTLEQILPIQLGGLLVAAASMFLEWLADRQLAQHRADPNNRGVTCRRGLWRYSRHPNYFFEWLVWCGFGLIHAPALGYWATAAPTAMLLSVRYFSGIPFTEKRALKTRGDDYRRYIATTNAFFPWPPRSAAAGERAPEIEA
ncbi:MAG: DUF1295 domain-containing protein [bacterium]|nr:DUF1295 domain-containing protein [bacterium]